MSLGCVEVEVRRGGGRRGDRRGPWRQTTVFCALRDVSCRFERGGLHVVVGPNGAGKSTLLQVLAGEIAPSLGHVYLGSHSHTDRALNDWSAAELARTRAVLEQQPQVPFAVAVWQFIGLGRLPHNTTAAQDEAVVGRCLQQLGLAALMARDVRSLSGGEQQRVHLARALAQLSFVADQEQSLDDIQGVVSGVTSRGWLLLDEPTAALDLGHADQTLAMLRRLCRGEGSGKSSGKSSDVPQLGAVIVLHDLGLALRHADTVTVLHAGKCVAVGTPAEVLQPALVNRVWGVTVNAIRDETGAVVALVPTAI